jgi:hypothetical protein
MVKGAPDFTLYNDNELVIFNDKINYIRGPKTTSGFTIGTIRIASRVQHEWVEQFVKRYSEVTSVFVFPLIKFCTTFCFFFY